MRAEFRPFTLARAGRFTLFGVWLASFALLLQTVLPLLGRPASTESVSWAFGGEAALCSAHNLAKIAAHGADVNARQERGSSGRGRFTITGSTPFLLAARSSDMPLARLLLDLGADPTIANKDNCTPLLAAAGVGALGDGEEAAGTEEEAIEMVRLLLELGADVNAVDDRGETALHGAAYQSRAKLVQFLVDHGADVHIQNRENEWTWTPLHIARGYRPGNFRPHPETIAAIEKVMLAAGVEPTKTPPKDPGGPVYQ